MGRRVVPASVLRRRHAARVVTERRREDRLGGADLGRPLGRRAPQARRAGHGRRAGSPGAARVGRHSAAHAPVRSHGGRPGLHQGLRPGNPGERRTVHACRGLGRPRAHTARERRRGGGTLPHAQSDQSLADSERGPAIHDRAVFGRGRRLRPPGSSRARRLDLVHGLGRLDVSRGPRGSARPHAPWRLLHGESVHSLLLAEVHHRMALRHGPLHDRGGEPGAPLHRRGEVELDGVPTDPGAVPLVDDGGTHQVRVVLGASRRTSPTALSAVAPQALS